MLTLSEVTLSVGPCTWKHSLSLFCSTVLLDAPHANNLATHPLVAPGSPGLALPPRRLPGLEGGDTAAEGLWWHRDRVPMPGRLRARSGATACKPYSIITCALTLAKLLCCCKHLRCFAHPSTPMRAPTPGAPPAQSPGASPPPPGTGAGCWPSGPGRPGGRTGQGGGPRLRRPVSQREGVGKGLGGPGAHVGGARAPRARRNMPHVPQARTGLRHAGKRGPRRGGMTNDAEVRATFNAVSHAYA